MSKPSPEEQEEWWKVYNYEVGMFQHLQSTSGLSSLIFQQGIQNAILESLLLHVRNLSEIMISDDRRDDNLTLKMLVPNFDSAKTKELKQAYCNGRPEHTPKWIIDKKLAHPTTKRTDHYDWGAVLNRMVPVLTKLIQQIDEHTKALGG